MSECLVIFLPHSCISGVTRLLFESSQPLGVLRIKKIRPMCSLTEQGAPGPSHCLPPRRLHLPSRSDQGTVWTHSLPVSLLKRAAWGRGASTSLCAVADTPVGAGPMTNCPFKIFCKLNKKKRKKKESCLRDTPGTP